MRRAIGAMAAVVLFTSGCSQLANVTGQYTCDSVADEALKIESTSGQPQLVGIVNRGGPTTDQSATPPNNGTVFSCTGTGVFNEGSEVPIEFGIKARDGQLFSYWEQKA